MADKYQEAVGALFEKYREDPYMISRVQHLITNQLPSMLDHISKTRDLRLQRTETLSNEQESFIDTFLNKHRYFYVSTTDRFFLYDGVHYIESKEDDILHHILTTITKDQSLMAWKQKTRATIMKHIRERSLLKNVPESATIQGILDLLYPLYFETKSEAKYFLAVLGDNIWRKPTGLVHFISTESKPFIHFLNSTCVAYLGYGLIGTIKHKYHEHDYDISRIVRINDNIRHENCWRSIIDRSIIDLLCVAAHYSTRYGSSDNYIRNSCNDPDIVDRVLFLKNHSGENIVALFIADYLAKLDDPDTHGGYITSTKISWKNMQYLWRHFLKRSNLPAIMFQPVLKQRLTEQLSPHYSPEEECFNGLTSQYLPAIQQFMQFWTENMVEDASEYDFEVEELASIFKDWCNKPQLLLNESQILDILTYYYPGTIIENEKYIQGFKCILWNKRNDIMLAMRNYRETLETQDLSRIVSFYDCYINYCKFYTSTGDSRLRNIVNKSYFEKYLGEYFAAFVVDGTAIQLDMIEFDY